MVELESTVVSKGKARAQEPEQPLTSLEEYDLEEDDTYQESRGVVQPLDVKPSKRELRKRRLAQEAEEKSHWSDTTASEETELLPGPS